MRARTTMTGLALTAGLALSMAPAGLASAGAPSADRATTSVVSHKAATTKAEQQRVEDYWTEARMKNATPVGVKVKPTKGKPDGGTSGSTAIAEKPQPRFGKVFFTSGNSNYVCSGTATNSGNGDVVTTAGHCVSDGGVYVTNFAFVPAYNNGARPSGTWTARLVLTTAEWKNGENYDYDAGFAVMNEAGSRTAR